MPSSFSSNKSYFNFQNFDDEWLLLINYFRATPLSWGKELVFTYGPLGFLSTGRTYFVNKYLLLFSDLFIFINYLIIFYVTLKTGLNKKLNFFLILIFCLFNKVFHFNSMTAICFMIFWSQKWPIIGINLSYLFRFLILSLSFFIKPNTFFILLVIFFISVFFDFFNKRDLKKILLLAFSLFLVVFMLALILNVHIYHYTFNLLELIKFYSELMYLNQNDFIIYLVLILILSTVLIVSSQSLNKIRDIGVIIFYFLVTFKQGFIRNDSAHQYEFIHSYFLLLLVFQPLFIKTKLTISHSLVMLQFLIVFGLINNVPPVSNLSTNLPANVLSYFESFKKTEGAYEYYKVPEELKTIVGNEKIDVIPCGGALMLVNNFNYSPRPVFQSYISATKKFSNINFDFYNSKRSPNFVLLGYFSIDNRYPLFDDVRVHYLLENKYKFKKSFIFDGLKFLLLEKKNDFKYKFVKKDKKIISINDDLRLLKNFLYEIKINYTVLGRVKALLFRAPRLHMLLKTTSGKTYKVRISKSLLESGIYSKDLMLSVDDLQKSYMGIDNEEITSYHLVADGELDYQKELVVTSYALEKD